MKRSRVYFFIFNLVAAIQLFPCNFMSLNAIWRHLRYQLHLWEQIFIYVP